MLAGGPALTRHRFGAGTGWYLSTRLDHAGCTALFARLLDEARVGPEVPGLPAQVEAVVRRAPDGRRRHVLINHRPEPVPLPEPAHDLLTGSTLSELPPSGCAVLRTT